MRQSKLPEIVLGVAILLAVIGVGIALWRSLPDMRLTLFGTPKIEMKLGDDWSAITANSTFPFRDIDGHRTGYATEWQTVDFVYTDSVHRLALPTARTVYFELEEDRTTRIQVLQLGDPADWDTTQERVRALVAQIERAGWTRTDGKSLDEALAGRKAFYDEFREFMNDQFLGSWYAGDARFGLSLYRTRSAGETVNGQTSPNDLFVINVSIVPDE